MTTRAGYVEYLTICFVCATAHFLIFHKIAERIGNKNLHNAYVNLHALRSQSFYKYYKVVYPYTMHT